MRDDNYIELTHEEWEEAAYARLAQLDITYQELKAKSLSRTMNTTETKLWLMIKGTLTGED